MWVEVKRAPKLVFAEMWKEFLEGEGLPARILPDPDKKEAAGESAPYRVYVSQEKEHVVKEVLRKL